MALIHLTRRELIAAAPLVVAAPGLLRAAQAEPDVWRFLVIGDWGRDGGQGQAETAKAMTEVARARSASEKSEFVISTGDNFYHWGVWSKNDRRWKTCFEDVYPADLGNWYAVLGNHDYGGSVRGQMNRHQVTSRWNMDDHCWDRVLTKEGRPPLHLIFFDTVAWIGEESFPFMLYGAQMNAATQERQRAKLTAALEASPKDAIRIAVGHHGIYSVGDHGGRKELEGLDELLRLHQVRAWVHGHDHCLFHIKSGAMHYVCSGAGSQVLTADKRGPDGCALLSGCSGMDEPPQVQSFFRDAPGTEEHIDGGFALFELGRDRGEFRFYGRRGAQVVKLNHDGRLYGWA